MVDPATLIDEADLLSRGDAGVAALLKEGRREGLGRRADAMALLLTELHDPFSLAAAVKADVDVERDVLDYLLALVDAYAGPASWPHSHEAIAQTLALLESEAQRCEARLAARLADQHARKTSIQPSPVEESDPIVRIWAARLREQKENVQFRAELVARTEEHLQRMIQIRRDAQGRR